MAYFTSLYSGSSGNCSVVRCGGEYLLIDMGKSCRVTLNALKGLGLPVSGMKGLLVTHEHSDHVAGLSVFLRHYNVPVYASAATLDHLDGLGLTPPGAELIAIEGRYNPKCRMTHMPKRYWNTMTEFQTDGATAGPPLPP